MKMPSLFLLFIFCFSQLASFSQSDKLHIAIGNCHVIKNDLMIDFVFDSQDSVMLKFYGGDKGFTDNCDHYWFTNHYVIVSKFDEFDSTFKTLSCNRDMDFIYNIYNVNDSNVIVTNEPIHQLIALHLNEFTDGTYKLAVGQVFFYRGVKNIATSGYIYFRVLKSKSKTKPRVIFYPTPSLAQL